MGGGAVDLQALSYARSQMALSLGWHIVIACLGVAFPAIVIFTENRAYRRGDPQLLALARTWAKAMGVLFAVGAVSGTVLSFEMGMLWPGLMSRFGQVYGFPFTLEGFAFFIEAIWHGLTRRGAPLVALSVLAGVAGLVLLFRESYRPARMAAALAVAAVIWGWGVAQYPLMLPPDVTVDNAAASSPTLNAMVVTLLAGSLLLVPALILLYRLFQTTPDRAPALTTRSVPTRSRPD